MAPSRRASCAGHKPSKTVNLVVTTLPPSLPELVEPGALQVLVLLQAQTPKSTPNENQFELNALKIDGVRGLAAQRSSVTKQLKAPINLFSLNRIDLRGATREGSFSSARNAARQSGHSRQVEGASIAAAQSVSIAFISTLSSVTKTSRFSPVSSAAMTLAVHARRAAGPRARCTTETSTWPTTGEWS